MVSKGTSREFLKTSALASAAPVALHDLTGAFASYVCGKSHQQSNLFRRIKPPAAVMA